MAATVTVISASATAASSGPQMLPSGYLSTRGAQIVDKHGHPVRIACVGGLGTCVAIDHLEYTVGPFRTVDDNIAAIKRLGFNCIRADWNDKCLDRPGLMADFDTLVATCKKYGVKIVLCHHNDEATGDDWSNVAQQSNGLWFDSGPGTDGSDDSKGRPVGTITNEKFTQDWVAIAKRYAGNDTVIGFDLDNEPHCNWGPDRGLNWGEGGPDDIWAMYTNVGNAIQTVDPGALIICEGPGDVTDKTSLIFWSGDLTHVVTKPVVLHIPGKVVYSPHEYPSEISGGSPTHEDFGPTYVKYLNADWGFVVKQNIAPIWVGEMGASMKSDNSHDWGKTLVDYMNGYAPDGPKFTKNEQPISGDWWAWNYAPDENPDGCLTGDGQLNPAQKPFIEQLQFWSAREKHASLQGK
jgi:aryl-phospho-beta-D-glucosidase BglC (GH1 family)